MTSAVLPNLKLAKDRVMFSRYLCTGTLTHEKAYAVGNMTLFDKPNSLSHFKNGEENLFFSIHTS